MEFDLSNFSPEELARLAKDLDKKVILMNAPRLTAFGRYTYRPATLAKVRSLVHQYAYTSAIGHASTADLLTELLDRLIPCNRVAVTQEPGDIVVVFQLLERQAEGAVLSLADLRETSYQFGILTMEEGT